jgi:3-deoxy-D-manno-octulosonic-acid transferase
MRFFYSLAWWLALPAVIGLLIWRSFARPAYRADWAERFGFYRKKPLGTPLRIWIHAVSVGETRAAQPLVLAMLEKYPSADILLTHMTPTGRKAGADLYAKLIEGKRLQQAYLPYDYSFAVHLFLKFWTPQLGLVMETEVWPNLMAAAKKQHVPMALVNARLSEKSLNKGRRFQTLMSETVECFDAIVAQSDQDAARIAHFAPSKVITISGNIKFDVKAPDEKIALGQHWRGLVARPVLLFASSREGEEPLFFDAMNAHMKATPNALPKNLLVVVVPRHPERFSAVGLMASKAGFTVERRSTQTPSPETQVWLGDSMGEMFAYYSMATVALLGGSFEPFGSQNLLEPMAVGCPVIVGPSRFNFDHVIREATLSGGAIGAKDMADAIEKASQLLTDPLAAANVSKAGTSFCAAHQGATFKTLQAVDRLISRANLNVSIGP